MTSRAKKKAAKRKAQQTEEQKAISRAFAAKYPAIEFDGQTLRPDPEQLTMADMRELVRIQSYGGSPSLGLQRRMIALESHHQGASGG